MPVHCLVLESVSGTSYRLMHWNEGKVSDSKKNISILNIYSV